MAVGNGKCTEGTTLPDAADMAGGVWHNSIDGAALIKTQLTQLQQLKQMQTAIAQMEVQRQLTSPISKPRPMLPRSSSF
jgi:hypothetical protein